MSRKICVVTSSRADYGLLKLLLKLIKDDSNLSLQLIATGTHFLKKYGETYQEIIEDGFVIEKKIEILSEKNDTLSVTESIGNGVNKFATALKELKPDLVLLLGDRFEIFAAAIASHVAQIPIIHIHGGELTEGAIDDAFRHSITKMSQMHFVATQEYANRVIQLGEQPNRVIISGALGVDAIHNLKLLSKIELEEKLGFKFGKKNLLITFHPVTLESKEISNQIDSLLAALEELTDTTLIFTMPNADPDSQIISDAIEKFVRDNLNAKFFKSLGQLAYLSCIPFVDGVVGNSSSGILEVPSFRKGSVNIGDRQLGRIMPPSVINCEPSTLKIISAIKQLYSKPFKDMLETFTNPYGSLGASIIIMEKMKKYDFGTNTKKKFFDIKLKQMTEEKI